MPIPPRPHGEAITALDVEKETKELTGALQQYAIEERDNVDQKIDRLLKRLDGQIDKLESRVDINWDNMIRRY